MSLEESNPEELSIDPSLLSNGWSITRTRVSRAGLPLFALRYRLWCRGVEVRMREFQVNAAQLPGGVEQTLTTFDNIAKKGFLEALPDIPELPS